MRHTVAKALSGAFLAALVLSGCKDVSERTLANGLRVIVKEDHRSPVVVSQIWYRVGSEDEPAGLTGISHALEHMMFKGTAAHGPNEFSRIIAENGGRENAFTSYDYTAYFQQLEKSRLPVAFELEADRMQHLTLDPKEFASEIKVVMEERRLRTEDQPDALLFEKFMHTAFQVHSYRNPIIGWMPDLEKLKVADLRAWYERWYVPNNATLVVSGDVKPADVFALAEKYFGSVPARPVRGTVVAVEPPQRGERRVHLALPAEVPQLVMGYHVPVLVADASGSAAWEPYALTVLAGVLDGGASARFQRELVRDQKVAAEIGCDYSLVARAPSELIIGGTPAEGRTVAQLESAVTAQIGRLRNDPVSDEELKRIKVQVVAADVFGRDSVFYQAMRIGRLAASGLDVGLLDRYVERVNAVTAKQVQEVARKYLTDENLTVAVLDPLPMPKGKRRSVGRMGVGDVR
jgi:zinc protease